ncbi:NAD(P)-binding protein, partial [Aureobasidium melanogenum]|jgi:NAD(P)-dependent dehydrogenase (short-subunit alcohol dehydrogenase family)
MSSDDKINTAYNIDIKAQDQAPGAGLDSQLDPPANWTQLEFWDDDENPHLEEYEGRGLLKNKTVLITGGDSGIGRSVAILMAREGADITICYLPEEQEDADWTLEQIKKAGRKGHGIALNLRDDGSCKKAVEEHVQVHGKLNVLVNNASMQEVCEEHADIDMDVVQKTFQTNIIQMMAMTKYALKRMKRGSSIINSCSVAGYMGNPSMVDYSSTKGAIASFTRSLAQQQAPKGIRVNAVAPGIIWTPLQAATKGNPPEALRRIGVAEAPIRRPGMPVEVATAYVFLASPYGSYFTGEALHGTGGLEVQG